MLAMEEDIGISHDFAEGMFRRFHDQITSSRCAAAQRKIQIPNPKLQTNSKVQIIKVIWCLEILWVLGLGLGFWQRAFRVSLALR